MELVADNWQSPSQHVLSQRRHFINRGRGGTGGGREVGSHNMHLLMQLLQSHWSVCLIYYLFGN